MKVWLLVVGKPGPLIVAAVAEYERRAARYWSFEVIEIKEERARKGLADEQIRAAEAERLLARVPAGAEVCALTRAGEAMSSDELAGYLGRLALHGRTGVAFLIGGALGLADDIAQRADRTLSISPMTLTHELAQLVLAEQLYRAGTIVRGEPYHKARR
ncbi:MAG: 23S rRNA (pseudouridine(1915)-N(3))-methyltransferase RlmH [Gemmatimonadota bacterium]